MNSVQGDQEKLVALLKKLAEAEERLKFRMGHFRGVPHESASGELAYSELKVLEDYVESLRKEVANLKEKLGLIKRA
jgi:hypothetical protein